MQVIDPHTGEPGARYELHDAAAIEARLAAADRAFETHRRTSLESRATLLRAVAERLTAERDGLAARMAAEMGKPITQGRAEVDKCAWVLEHYAAAGARYLADERIETDAADSRVVHRPLGVLFAIMPWNFPFWQVFRQAAPALMAGNASVLKHAENVPGCALAIERLFQEAGAPEGLFTTLLCDRDAAADVIADARVRAVSLTGSTRAGRAVARAAGEALKPTILELGGSDPYVVLADADLEHAATACVASRLVNSGQSCIAAKRWIVEAPVAEAFLEIAVDKMRAATVGAPLEEDTAVGPMARADLREELGRQVRASVEQGARLACGGAPVDGPGFYYPPTVLADVRPGMPAFDEELFGPAAAMTVAADEADAIALANRSVFGLGAAVFTADEARGRRIAEDELRAGAVAVNDFVRSDPRLPFGGIGESGYGRELAGAGIRALCNVKTVVTARPTST